MSSVLEQGGYRVLLAENGRKALELCQNQELPIDALITDVVMPETNGRELAERARLLRPGLKVLFVSGYVDRGIRDQSEGSSSFAFLEKPFSAEDLLDAVGAFSTVSIS